MKNFSIFLTLLMSLIMMSCGNNSDEPNNPATTIVGYWFTDPQYEYYYDDDENKLEEITLIGYQFCESGKIIVKDVSKWTDSNGKCHTSLEYFGESLFWYIGNDGEIWFFDGSIDEEDKQNGEKDRYNANIKFINNDKIKWTSPQGDEYVFLHRGTALDFETLEY